MEPAEKKSLEKWKEKNRKYLLHIINMFEEDEKVKEFVLTQRKETETYIMQSKESVEGAKYHIFNIVKHPQNAIKLA